MPNEQTATDAEQSRRLRADAAHLAQVSAPADLADGLWVHDLGTPPGELQGLAVGSGHAFSRWAGDRLGRRCVGVAVGGVLELCRSRKATDVAAPLVESIALHEVGHILWGKDESTLQEIDRHMRNLAGLVPILGAPRRKRRSHGLAWAATITLLADRARRYRRDHLLLLSAIETDLANHGWDYQSLIQAIGPTDPEAPLTELLDPAGIIMRKLLASQLHYQRPLTTQTDQQHGAAAAACFPHPR